MGASEIKSASEEKNSQPIIFKFDFNNTALCRPDLYNRLKQLQNLEDATTLSDNGNKNAPTLSDTIKELVIIKKIITPNINRPWYEWGEYDTTFTIEEITKELDLLKKIKLSTHLDNSTKMALEEYSTALFTIIYDVIKVKNPAPITPPEAEPEPSFFRIIANKIYDGVSFFIRCITFVWLTFSKFAVIFVPVSVTLGEGVPFIASLFSINIVLASSPALVLGLAVASTFLTVLGIYYFAPFLLQKLGITSPAKSATPSQVYLEQCEISQKLNSTLPQGLSYLNINSADFEALSKAVNDLSWKMMALKRQPPEPKSSNYVKAIKANLMLINLILSAHGALGIATLLNTVTSLTTIIGGLSVAAGFAASTPLLMWIGVPLLFTGLFGWYHGLASATVLNALDTETAKNVELTSKLESYVAVDSNRLAEIAGEKKYDDLKKAKRLKMLDNPEHPSHKKVLNELQAIRVDREKGFKLDENQDASSLNNLNDGRQTIQFLKNHNRISQNVRKNDSGSQSDKENLSPKRKASK